MEQFEQTLPEVNNNLPEIDTDLPEVTPLSSFTLPEETFTEEVDMVEIREVQPPPQEEVPEPEAPIVHDNPNEEFAAQRETFTDPKRVQYLDELCEQLLTLLPDRIQGHIRMVASERLHVPLIVLIEGQLRHCAELDDWDPILDSNWHERYESFLNNETAKCELCHETINDPRLGQRVGCNPAGALLQGKTLTQPLDNLCEKYKNYVNSHGET